METTSHFSETDTGRQIIGFIRSVGELVLSTDYWEDQVQPLLPDRWRFVKPVNPNSKTFVVSTPENLFLRVAAFPFARLVTYQSAVWQREHLRMLRRPQQVHFVQWDSWTTSALDVCMVITERLGESAHTVVTSWWEEGAKIATRPVTREEFAFTTRALLAACAFHGDLHLGNCAIDETGRLTAFDFPIYYDYLGPPEKDINTLSAMLGGICTIGTSLLFPYVDLPYELHAVITEDEWNLQLGDVKAQIVDRILASAINGPALDAVVMQRLTTAGIVEIHFVEHEQSWVLSSQDGFYFVHPGNLQPIAQMLSRLAAGKILPPQVFDTICRSERISTYRNPRISLITQFLEK